MNRFGNIEKLVREDGFDIDAKFYMIVEGENPITKKWYINYDRAIEWTDGQLVRLQISTDITDLKRMEEELRQA